MSILKTTIKEEAMERKNGLPPIHPGEIIKEDILPSTGLSVTAVAKALGVSRQMLHDILAGRKPLSTVMCLKVSRLFGGTPELWMRLQAAYDLFPSRQPPFASRPNANLIRKGRSICLPATAPEGPADAMMASFKNSPLPDRTRTEWHVGL